MTDGRPWSPVPVARGSHGGVVAPHHLATAAGLAILRAGGSAVDAAIATNAALGVVMPSSPGRCVSTPAMAWRASADNPAWPPGSDRRFTRWSVSQMLQWMWAPLPA